jgi:hypothetical protein
MRRKILKVINITTDDGGMGMYFKENEVIRILPNNQPSKLRLAIKSKRNRNDSFLLIK